MSSYTYYQAIPERSRLLERLTTDERFHRLYARLVPCGPGPFRLDEFDPEELEEVLDGFVDDGLFGSRVEVDGCLEDLAVELAEAVAAHPGLKGRAAYIEKQHVEIEEAVARRLRRRGRGIDVEPATALLYGGETSLLDFPAGREPRVGFIPALTVARGAGLLSEIELSEEADDVDDYAVDQFREWKLLLTAAAESGEAIMTFSF